VSHREAAGWAQLQAFMTVVQTVREHGTAAAPWLDADAPQPRHVRRGLLASGNEIFEVFSPDGTVALTESGHDLALRPVNGEDVRLLTTDGSDEQPWSLAGVDDFARSRLGGAPCSSARWSPDGRWVAVHRLNFTGVAAVPIVDWLDRDTPVEYVRYSKTGGGLHRTETYLIDVATGERVRVEVDTSDGEAARSFIGSWFPPAGDDDGVAQLSLITMNRTCQQLRLLTVDPRTGIARDILTEKVDTFHQAMRWLQLRATQVEPPNIATPLPDGSGFVWLADRDRFSHLYLLDREGDTIRQLTAGPWDVERVVGIDAHGRVVFLARDDPDRPTDIRACRVPLAGGDVEVLTPEPGVHDVVFRPDFGQCIDAHSDLARPRRTVLRDGDGTVLDTLAVADLSAIDALGHPAPQGFTAPAADGTTRLHGQIFHPPGFDPQRSWPLLEHIYGGPNVDYVNWRHPFAATGMARMMSMLGYVVVSFDATGTPGRGRDFHERAYGRIGPNAVADHAAVVSHLLDTRPWLDRERVGIYGGSLGGYMASRAVLERPDVYRAAASSIMVSDFEDVRAGGIEPYMGMPEDHPDRYAEASLPDRAADLQRPLLIVHGTADVNATFSAAMRFTNALVDAGRLHELCILPGTDHALGPRMGYYLRLLATFFETHLGSGSR